jgi:hypothetical protein
MTTPVSVYRNGTWIHYDVSETATSIWTESLKLRVASVYATAITKGISKQRSIVLAECYANKVLYGVTYTSQIEEELKLLLI